MVPSLLRPPLPPPPRTKWTRRVPHPVLIGHAASNPRYPPFYADDRMQLYQAILAGKLEFPRHMKKEARDLISRLLTSDLSRRIGNLKAGAKDIRNHPWFKGFDWEALLNRTIPAPITFSLKGEDDTSMFDEYDENEGPETGAGRVRPEDQKLFASF
jgi:serine/threonine protein kinase